MAKITLTFEFDSYEEAEEIETTLNAGKWKAAFWSLDQALRDTTKYGASLERGGGEATPAEIEAAERCRDLIREKLNEYNLFLN